MIEGVQTFLKLIFYYYAAACLLFLLTWKCIEVFRSLMALPSEDPDPFLCSPHEKRAIDELCGDKLFDIYADKLLDQTEEEDGEVVETDDKCDPPPAATEDHQMIPEPPAGVASNFMMNGQSGQMGSMPPVSDPSTVPPSSEGTTAPPPPAPAAVMEPTGSGGEKSKTPIDPAPPGPSTSLVEQAVGAFKNLLEEDARERKTAPDADKILSDILAEYDQHKRTVIKRPTRMILKFIRNDEYIWDKLVMNSMLFSSFLTLVDRELKEEPLAFITNGERSQRSSRKDRDQNPDRRDDRDYRRSSRSRDRRDDRDPRRSSRSNSDRRRSFRGYITPNYNYANNNQGPVPIVNHLPYSTVAGGPAPLDITRPPPPLPPSASGSRAASSSPTGPTPYELKEDDTRRRQEYQQRQHQSKETQQPRQEEKQQPRQEESRPREQPQREESGPSRKRGSLGDAETMGLFAQFLKFQNFRDAEKKPPVIDVSDEDGDQGNPADENQDSGGQWEEVKNSKRRKK